MGLDLLLLLPQELGAKSRDEGQGRCPSMGSIWGPEFRTGPTELPPAGQDGGIQLLRVGALLVFPDTRCRSLSQVCWAHLSFGTKRLTGIALSPSPPSPRELVPKPSWCLIPLRNDCIWVTFSNPSPLCPPVTSAAPAAPLALSSPRGPQHRSGLINPRRAPKCPSQLHVSHPPGRVHVCLRGQCRSPSAVPAVPVTAWVRRVGGPQGGHPDFEGQLPPGAPGKLQAGRSRGHPQGVGSTECPRAAGCGSGCSWWDGAAGLDPLWVAAPEAPGKPLNP